MLKFIIVFFFSGYVVAKSEGVDISLSGSQQISYVDVPGSQASSTTAKMVANKYRNFLYIRNHHASQPLYVTFSSGATGSAGVVIAGGAVWQPNPAPVNNLYLITGSSTGVSATIISGN